MVALIVSGRESEKPSISKEKIDKVQREVESLKRWLHDKEAEQQKISASSTPAYTSQEVISKLLDLQDKVASTNRIPKPVKNDTENQKDEPKSSSSSKDDNSDSQIEETDDGSTHDEL